MIAVQQGLTLPQVFNQGVVALLPKTDAIHPLSGQFRPITLLNVDYKIIAGVMTERIKLVIPHLIHNTQTGFVPGRLIFENLTFTRDLIDWAHYKKASIHIAFLDFEKAFDRVNWWFRTQVLTALGFPSCIIHMVHSLYNEAMVRLNINGTLSPCILQTRGVRQGCPLSPFIFAMFVEPLGELLRDHARTLGLPLPHASRSGSTHHILCTQFADDTTLYSAFADDLVAAQTLIEEEFCTASGAKLNTDKTKVYCTTTPTHISSIHSSLQSQALQGQERVK